MGVVWELVIHWLVDQGSYLLELSPAALRTRNLPVNRPRPFVVLRW